MKKFLQENHYPAVGADYLIKTHAFGGVLNFIYSLRII